MPLEDRQLFLLMFDRGREDAVSGADEEMQAWTLRTAGEEAALAGYIEGLAAVRVDSPLIHRASGRDRTCGRDSYAGYQAHWSKGEPACLGCLAANRRRARAIRQQQRRRVMAV